LHHIVACLNVWNSAGGIPGPCSTTHLNRSKNRRG
jgi:hypothetical protein